jgi:cell division protein FtsA
MIGLLENSHVRLLGCGETESRAWSKGRLADQDALTACIRAAVEDAEKCAGVSVGSAVVGVGGATVQGVNSRGLYEMGFPREIDAADVRYAVELGARVHLPPDKVLLHVFPQDFAVDGRVGYRNPRGATGSRLESFVHLIVASAQEHQCIINAAHQACLAVEDTMYEPMAAAYAAIPSDDRTEGAALLDIGAHSSDLVVFYGEALLLAASLPISGDHFTRDVSHGLCIGFEDAQRLKEQCGCAILGLTSDANLIEVPSPEGRPPRETTRRELNSILEARAEELFLHVRREVARAGMEDGLVDGIVLTGAGARLTGMCDMAERALNCQARNGVPVGLEAWPEDVDSLAWTTASGLMMYSARLKHREGEDRGAVGLLGRLLR